MFRIKNVRGSTVAKTNNLSPQIPQYPHNPPPKKIIPNQKIPEITKNTENKYKIRPANKKVEPKKIQP